MNLNKIRQFILLAKIVRRTITAKKCTQKKRFCDDQFFLSHLIRSFIQRDPAKSRAKRHQKQTFTCLYRSKNLIKIRRLYLHSTDLIRIFEYLKEFLNDLNPNEYFNREILRELNFSKLFTKFIRILFHRIEPMYSLILNA